MQIKIEYINDHGKIIPLMSDRILAKKQKFAQDRLREAKKIKNFGMETEAYQAELESDMALAQIEDDKQFRFNHKEEIHSAVFEIREPTLSDQRDLLKVQNESDVITLKEKTLETFNPTCSDFPDIPLRLKTVLSDELLAEVFYDLEEEKQIFTMGLSKS